MLSIRRAWRCLGKGHRHRTVDFDLSSLLLQFVTRCAEHLHSFNSCTYPFILFVLLIHASKMKYTTACIIALAGLTTAIPMPQFSLPSFGLPSFPLPTGGFSIPGFSGIPSLPSATGGISLPSGGISLPSTGGAAVTSVAAQPTSTGSTGGGTVGADCTPQSSNGGSTENGVADKNCCTDVTVVFARGTGELGNVGTIAGPPMFESLRSKLGTDRVTVQGVDYPASAAVSSLVHPTPLLPDEDQGH